jgi:hypothetical protein
MNVILEELNYIMLEEVLQNSARGVIEQCERCYRTVRWISKFGSNGHWIDT